MNPEDTNEVKKPDFDGAEMKMPENNNVTMAEPEQKIISGPILLLLALVLIAVLGGLYYWFASMSIAPTPSQAPIVDRPTAAENNEPESTTAEAQAESMQVMSTSDEIDAIEADLESTDLDELDAELETIDAELEAAASAE